MSYLVKGMKTTVNIHRSTAHKAVEERSIEKHQFSGKYFASRHTVHIHLFLFHNVLYNLFRWIINKINIFNLFEEIKVFTGRFESVLFCIKKHHTHTRMCKILQYFTQRIFKKPKKGNNANCSTSMNWTCRINSQVQFQSYLIFSKRGGEGLVSRPSFTSGNTTPDTHYTGDYACPRAILKAEASRKKAPTPGI
jgi:hypothetical protein